jgi:hypothetical protein
VQTVVYRLERKKALRCIKRISSANIFEEVVSRKDAERRLVDELLGLFGGRAKLECSARSRTPMGLQSQQLNFISLGWNSNPPRVMQS